MPPEHDVVKEAAENNVINKNYLREMKVNFKLISNRWVKRRDDQIKRLNNYQNGDMDENERKYPFTYLIDCLIEECRANSVVSKFLSKILLTIKFIG